MLTHQLLPTWQKPIASRDLSYPISSRHVSRWRMSGAFAPLADGGACKPRATFPVDSDVRTFSGGRFSGVPVSLVRSKFTNTPSILVISILHIKLKIKTCICTTGQNNTNFYKVQCINKWAKNIFLNLIFINLMPIILNYVDMTLILMKGKIREEQ